MGELEDVALKLSGLVEWGFLRKRQADPIWRQMRWPLYCGQTIHKL
ncbi:hypothetical protein [Rhizobium laguerreae]|nr:hypothetical protein [Rhizobium laguerreae]MBN9987694.1 hypothetical protein [Rhizobium laguerreae]